MLLSSLIVELIEKSEESKEEEAAPDEDADMTLRCYFVYFPECPVNANLPVVIFLSLNNAAVFMFNDTVHM